MKDAFSKKEVKNIKKGTIGNFNNKFYVFNGRKWILIFKNDFLLKTINSIL